MWINHKDWYSSKEYKVAQDSWVRHYREKLRNSGTWWSPHTKFVKAQEYYRDGRIYGRLNLMDFQQFNKRMTDPYDYYYYGSKNWKRDRIRDHYKYNRNGKKNPKDYSEKKVLTETEQAKREWREFKKVRKDKSKTYPGKEPMPFCKRLRNRRYRSYIRNEIRKDRYEFTQTPESLMDIWYWD